LTQKWNNGEVETHSGKGQEKGGVRNGSAWKKEEEEDKGKEEGHAKR